MPIHDWTTVDAGIFHHFHQAWINALARALNRGRLPKTYYALAEQIAGGLGPDVLTLENAGAESDQNELDHAGDGGIAVATALPKTTLTAEADLRHYAGKSNRIAIRHTSGDRVVAVIELVSPGNKSSRRGLESFVRKAAELIEGNVHLLVVDVFPPSRRDPEGIHGAIWSEIEAEEFVLPPDRPLTSVAYEAGEIVKAWIEPMAVGGLLPEMPIFLAPRRHVLVPLEGTYMQAWDDLPVRWRDRIGHGGK
ncbi:MAG: DUF4058 family protein [Gemmataceae bacterium]|nr:DUF4058 family protein [Gemmataceae bacterium]